MRPGLQSSTGQTNRESASHFRQHIRTSPAATQSSYSCAPSCRVMQRVMPCAILLTRAKENHQLAKDNASECVIFHLQSPKHRTIDPMRNGADYEGTVDAHGNCGTRATAAVIRCARSHLQSRGAPHGRLRYPLQDFSSASSIARRHRRPWSARALPIRDEERFPAFSSSPAGPTPT